MTIWEIMEDALTAVTIPKAANALIIATGGELPDHFLVYFLVDSPPEQAADNKETMRSYRVQINIFSRTGLVGLPDVAGMMTIAGFTRGSITEIPYDLATRHFGLAQEFTIIESED